MTTQAGLKLAAQIHVWKALALSYWIIHMKRHDDLLLEDTIIWEYLTFISDEYS